MDQLPQGHLFPSVQKAAHGDGPVPSEAVIEEHKRTRLQLSHQTLLHGGIGYDHTSTAISIFLFHVGGHAALHPG
jgi:hypothetical protein